MNELARSGQGAEAALTGALPEKIWKYHVNAEIGRGSCGVVYKGFDPFVRREVAIKIATRMPAASDAAGTLPQQSTTLQAGDTFFTEARAAGMLQHPHIVSLYDAGIEAGLKFLVMEFIDGETLQPRCRRAAERTPLDQAIDIAFKCAKALEYAHSKGVLHRDIKPSNIMLTLDGTPKIMDFSIAEINTSPEAGRGGVVGSPLYMAPEQVRGEPLGPTSDLHALGAVLFHLLTGVPPYMAQDRDTLFELIKNEPAPRLSTLRPELPTQVSEIVARLLEKNPADRFQNGKDLAVQLARQFEKLKTAEQKISRRESRDSLRNLRFFDSFTDDEIEEMLSAGSITPYMAGETIIRESEIDNAFFVIVEGVAEVTKGGKPVSRLGRGDCFGEVAFLTSVKRTASVVAATPVRAIKMTTTLMEQVSRDCQLRFYKVFTETLVSRLTQTTAKLSAKS